MVSDFSSVIRRIKLQNYAYFRALQQDFLGPSPDLRIIKGDANTELQGHCRDQ